MHRRYRVDERRIWKGTMVAGFLTMVLVAGALLAPDLTGWLGLATSPVVALGAMVNLARNGGMSSDTSGYYSRRVYFVLLLACCIGWAAMVLFLLARS